MFASLNGQNNISDLITDGRLQIDITIDNDFNRHVLIKADTLIYQKCLEGLTL